MTQSHIVRNTPPVKYSLGDSSSAPAFERIIKGPIHVRMSSTARELRVSSSAPLVASPNLIQIADNSTKRPAVSETLVAPSQTAHLDADPIASLSPRQRLSYLRRKSPFDLAATVLSLPAAIYMVYRAATTLWPELGLSFSIAAMAQDNGVSTMFKTARDAFDWLLALVLGVILLASFAATLIANSEQKVTFCQDITKLILGFVIGFLSGGPKLTK